MQIEIKTSDIRPYPADLLAGGAATSAPTSRRRAIRKRRSACSLTANFHYRPLWQPELALYDQVPHRDT